MVDVVTFNGIRYRRYPDSPHECNRKYYTPGIGDKQHGYSHLHVDVWKYVNGRDVPEGCEIHHRDFDPLNNHHDNLVCLTVAEHKEAHREQQSERMRQPWALEHLERIRPLAAPWHSSPEGLEWHRQHAAEIGFGRPVPRDCACDQCGKPFTAYDVSGHARFCSNNCKSAWRRASGVDDIDRDCAACGGPFRVNRYSKVRCCSRPCGQALRRREKGAGLQPVGS